jgi:hypothetical protein
MKCPYIDAFDVNFNFPNAIWFQRQGSLKACIHRINDRYDFQVYETKHGMRTLLKRDNRDTLSNAKSAVFEFFNKEK